MIVIDKNMIVDFLKGEGDDHFGRKYKEMLGWSDQTWEKSHNAIQWIFPLHEKSRHSEISPVLNEEIVREAKRYYIILNNLRIAKQRFEKFFAIGEYEDIDRQRRWCHARNHNLLRITRIIRSLRLFGLEEDSYVFYRHVLQAANRFGIPSSTYFFWECAYTDDIWDTLQV